MKFNFLLEDSGYWSISIRKGYNWFLTDMHRHTNLSSWIYIEHTTRSGFFFFFHIYSIRSYPNASSVETAYKFVVHFNVCAAPDLTVWRGPELSFGGVTTVSGWVHPSFNLWKNLEKLPHPSGPEFPCLWMWFGLNDLRGSRLWSFYHWEQIWWER